MGHVPPQDHDDSGGAEPGRDPFDRDFVSDVLRPVFGELIGAAANQAEGLRERKKRLLRQRISDTATAMFFERGFDDVKVSEIAAACEVSEKTVFNYFPTKESLLFDREDYEAQMIAEALRDRGDGASLVDAIVAVLEADLNITVERWASTDDPQQAFSTLRRFGELIEETTALQAAYQGMCERLVQVAAQALAERAGVDPEDPEPQLAATVVLGLWTARHRAMHRHADDAVSMDELKAAVLDEVQRAARVADTGLSSFNLVVHPGVNSREQLRDAAAATNEARKQVVAAVKQARDAWKLVVAEAKAHHQADQANEQIQRELRAEQQRLRQEIRERQREIRQRQAELRRQQQARHQRGGGRGRPPGRGGGR
jgi:AcrR family transcriptional regulator